MAPWERMEIAPPMTRVAGVLDMRMRCEEDQTPMSGNSRHPFARLPEVLVLPVVRSDHIASLALGISGLGLRQCFFSLTHR